MLTFLLSVILIVGAIWLAVVARWFRWVLVAIGVLVLAVVLYFVNDHYSRKREEEASKHRIPVSQVQFEDLTMDGQFSRVTGRVRNTSPSYTLTGAELEIFVQDCVPVGKAKDDGYTFQDSKQLLDTVNAILDASEVPDGLKKSARDAFWQSVNTDDFKRRFDRLLLPKKMKADLWDLKFSRLDLDAERKMRKLQEECETVGQTKVTSWGINVPPTQSRAIDEYVYFSSLPPARGTYRWNYRVVYVKGSKPK